MMCNFGDAEKIKDMLKKKYVDACEKFEIKETRNKYSSLHDICILTRNGELILTLEPTLDGYTIKNIGSFVTLEFVGDVYNSIV